METVKINAAVRKTYTKDGQEKEFWSLVYNSDKEAITFDKGIAGSVNQDVNVEIAPSTKPGGSPIFKPVGATNAQGGKNYSKPWGNPNLDIYKSSILLAMEWMKATGTTINETTLASHSKIVENWLRNGFEAPAKQA